MKFTPLLAAILAGAVAATANPNPATATRDPTFCERGVKLCNLAQEFDDCSDVYIAAMKACVLTRCIQWVMDPLAHCKNKEAQ